MLPLKKALDFPAATSLPSSERDMWMEGPALRPKPDLLTDALYLRGKRYDTLPRLDAGPKCASRSLLKTAGAADPKAKSIKPNSSQRFSKIIG